MLHSQPYWGTLDLAETSSSFISCTRIKPIAIFLVLKIKHSKCRPSRFLQNGAYCKLGIALEGHTQMVIPGQTELDRRGKSWNLHIAHICLLRCSSVERKKFVVDLSVDSYLLYMNTHKSHCCEVHSTYGIVDMWKMGYMHELTLGAVCLERPLIKVVLSSGELQSTFLLLQLTRHMWTNCK